MRRIIIKVYGLVQGVFFRYTTRKVARKLGLLGIVKNMPDGSVYIEAEGPEENLSELLKYAKRGPKYAEVTNIEYEYTDSQSKYKGFDYAF
ncbi:MAG: acylphosphatase [Promethearchaeota archaeon]|nr:MAG: acylphosphatase [Candidatus Lokiarchaeota archaeon]